MKKIKKIDWEEDGRRLSAYRIDELNGKLFFWRVLFFGALAMFLLTFCLAYGIAGKADSLEYKLNVSAARLVQESNRADHWKKRAAFWKAAEKSTAKMAYDCAHDHPKWGKPNP